MRQPCVQLNVFQINDNPFNNIMKLIYASPLKRGEYQLKLGLLLNVTTSKLDAWWKIPSWCLRRSTHDLNHDLIMRPIKCVYVILVSCHGEK